MSGYHKTSISLDPDLAQRASDRANALGFGNSFSAYVAKLIREDLAEGDALAESSAATTPANPKPAKASGNYRKSLSKPKAKVA
jgi:hypothetical protein